MKFQYLTDADAEAAAERRFFDNPDSDEPAFEADENIDGFTNWLCNECTYAKPVTLPCLRNTREAAEVWADGATVQQLVAGLMSPRADVRELAAGYLRNKWLEEASKPVNPLPFDFPAFPKVGA